MRDSTKELIAIYKALIALMEQENGITEFQYDSMIDGEWCDCNTPTAPYWGLANTFRVKPNPAEGWAWKYPSGVIVALYDQKQPDNSPLEGRTMVLMREVTK